ncbi:unnamed protein product [Polarella glacialis]|uniref:Fibronectin type III-like domain-containing protein n=1 Tax=Polarella glacialis TaxID=89957 RepID=A0A813DI43_POLGL|nr:unnamed protein product [Polarella glacialis]
MGPRALALSLFGQANRWGRLPHTLYPHSYINEQPMDNFDMAKSPGRTYKYYQGQPLFPFGFGLSYTSFDSQCEWQHGESQAKATAVSPVECAVRNTGAMSGDEVLLAYHVAGDDVRAQAAHPVPFSQLRAFDRVSLAPAASAKLVFNLSQDDLRLVDAEGHEHLYAGSHVLFFTGVGGRVVATLKVTVPVQSEESHLKIVI